MRILITGGGGYIGSVLVGHLLRKGHIVTVVDDLLYRVHGLYQYCAESSFGFVRGDVRDESLMRKLIADKDVILPLAALVGMPACARDPAYASSTNYEAVALMNRLRSREQWVIYHCTKSGFGTKSGGIYRTEQTPLELISGYGSEGAPSEAVSTGLSV